MCYGSDTFIVVLLRNIRVVYKQSCKLWWAQAIHKSFQLAPAPVNSEACTLLALVQCTKWLILSLK